MSDLTHRDTESPDVVPDVFVVRVDCNVESSRVELLARLRHPEGDGMHTPFWRFETKGGRVLAERYGGEVIIHADVCRAELGEDI